MYVLEMSIYSYFLYCFFLFPEKLGLCIMVFAYNQKNE